MIRIMAYRHGGFAGTTTAATYEEMWRYVGLYRGVGCEVYAFLNGKEITLR